MADFKPKPRDKNILDSKKIVLSVPCPVKGVKGFSNLHYYANNDNPGITVYTGDPGDKENNFGRIQAKMGILDMQIHLQQILATLRSKEAVKNEMFCLSVRGQDKKRVPVARVEVGKRPDGVMYVMVEDLEIQNRPKIYFPFAPTYWHTLARNGEPLGEAEVSQLCAEGLVRLVSDLVNVISKDTYKHPEPKQQGQGGGGYNKGGGGGYGGQRGGGGGNYGGGGGGGGGRSYESNDAGSGGGGDASDEDIPW